MRSHPDSVKFTWINRRFDEDGNKCVALMWIRLPGAVVSNNAKAKTAKSPNNNRHRTERNRISNEWKHIKNIFWNAISISTDESASNHLISNKQCFLGFGGNFSLFFFVFGFCFLFCLVQIVPHLIWCVYVPIHMCYINCNMLATQLHSIRPAESLSKTLDL